MNLELLRCLQKEICAYDKRYDRIQQRLRLLLIRKRIAPRDPRELSIRTLLPTSPRVLLGHFAVVSPHSPVVHL
jgi:hypothetical protein